MSDNTHATDPYDLTFNSLGTGGTSKPNTVNLEVDFTIDLPSGNKVTPGTPTQENASSINWPWTVTKGTPPEDNTYVDSSVVTKHTSFARKVTVTIQIMAEGSGAGSDPVEEVSMETSDVLP